MDNQEITLIQIVEQQVVVENLQVLMEILARFTWRHKDEKY
jgi:hypothetical protein